jgi:hypothetical protein
MNNQSWSPYTPCPVAPQSAWTSTTEPAPMPAPVARKLPAWLLPGAIIAALLLLSTRKEGRKR